MTDESLKNDGRRLLMRTLLGTGFTSSILSFLYRAIRFMWPPAVSESAVNEAPAGKATDLRPNSGRIFKFGARPGILVRTESGEFRAFSAICTHLNCTVQYRPERHDIWCACHNGIYDLNGRVIGGPPPRPLEEFKVNIRGEDIVVSKQA